MPEENKIKKEDPKVDIDTSGPEVDVTLPEEKVEKEVITEQEPVKEEPVKEEPVKEEPVKEEPKMKLSKKKEKVTVNPKLEQKAHNRKRLIEDLKAKRKKRFEKHVKSVGKEQLNLEDQPLRRSDRCGSEP